MIVNKLAPGEPGLFVLSVSETEKAAAFYHSLFGWTIDDTGTFRVGEHIVAEVEHGDDGWLPYLTVTDLDSALALAETAGAQVTRPPTQGPAGRRAVILEPSDAHLGLWQDGSGPRVGVMAEPGAVVWLEEKTHRQATATSFLTAMFGFEVFGVEGPGGVRLLRGPGPIFGAVMQLDDRWSPDEAPHWLLYFQVVDVDATVNKVLTAGGSVWFDPFDTPLGRMAYVRDPAGNGFSVVCVSEQGHAITGRSAS